MNKPQPIKEFVILEQFDHEYRTCDHILFCSNKAIVEEISEFGKLMVYASNPNKYAYTISPLFDRGEVINYLKWIEGGRLDDGTWNTGES